jgi:hypothetical protein
MSRLGSGDLNLPFEPSSGEMLDAADAEICGGMVVMAATIPVPDVGTMPVLVFRFSRPDGTFLRPITLVVEPHEALGAGLLVTRAAEAAVKAAADAV